MSAENSCSERHQRGKRMKKLLITLLLISPFSFADWGDVYHCQMTNLSGVTLEGEKENYKLEKFTFKLDEIKNAMVFGKGGYLSNYEMGMEEGMAFPSMEMWWGISPTAMSYFKDGKFLASSVSDKEATTISADCDKF
jgi:hypothetical protein